jgi:hypothetical protein
LNRLHFLITAPIFCIVVLASAIASVTSLLQT